MVWLLRKCVQCHRYTLNQEKCPHCGGKALVPHPAKFSPQDKYAKYRRAMRVEEAEQVKQIEGDIYQGKSQN